MEFLLTYRMTDQIRDFLVRLDVAKKVIDVMPRQPQKETHIKRASLLKSSVYSARIEGNTLGIEDVTYEGVQKRTDNIRKREIANILSTLRYVQGLSSRHHLSAEFLCDLHERVMKHLSPEAGRFRTEASAIFNMAGVAIYMPPSPQDIPTLIDHMILHAQHKDIPVPIRSALIHVEFEKIHPFLDGNGRVGRVLSMYLIHKGGYGMRGMMSFETYLSEYRSEYYDLLAESGNDKTLFVEFFLHAMVKSAEDTLDHIGRDQYDTPEKKLLPRRQEILAIVRDHRYISFDAISRRFSRVSKSTMHNDIRVLIEKKYIQKLGETRGVYYQAL